MNSVECVQETTTKPLIFSALDALVLGWLKRLNARGNEPTAAGIACKAGCTERQAEGVLFHFRGPVVKNHTRGTYHLDEPAVVIEYQLAPCELFSLWLEYGEPRSPEEAEKIRIALRTRVLRMGPTVLMDPKAADAEIQASLANGRFQLRGDKALIQGRVPTGNREEAQRAPA